MSQQHVTPHRTRVCYYMQTHTRPAQVLRLVGRIKEASPDSVILIHHDVAGLPLDTRRLESFAGVHVVMTPGGYGNFSHLDRYFAAIDWLDEHGIEFDWLQNMTGQDYPLQPVTTIDRFLANSDADGYLQYAPVFPERTPLDVDWGAGPQYRLCSPFDTAMRFDFRHRWIGRPTKSKQRWLRPIMVIDWLQPWVRVSLAYSTVAIRRRSTIFNNTDFICYGGSFFCTLSSACVNYARDFARDNPDIVAFFRTMPAPNEVFLQTVLVNSKKFNIVSDGKRYIDWSRSRNNHPKTLGVSDLPAMLASGAHWARKFDSDHDAEVLDLLDRHIAQQPPHDDRTLQHDER